MKHSLSDRNEVDRTATCSVCGPGTPIRRNRAYWLCGTKAKADLARWKQANPEKTAANRRRVSLHHLTEKDAAAGVGTCPLCGPTAIVPWGRGYICQTRAEELRSVQQSEPQGFCGSCRAETEDQPRPLTVWLRQDGSCPRCTDESLTDLGGLLKQDHDLQAEWESILAEVGEGYSPMPADPYSMPDFESAVPGWRTIA